MHYKAAGYQPKLNQSVAEKGPTVSSKLRAMLRVEVANTYSNNNHNNNHRELDQFTVSWWPPSSSAIEQQLSGNDPVLIDGTSSESLRLSLSHHLPNGCHDTNNRLVQLTTNRTSTLNRVEQLRAMGISTISLVESSVLAAATNNDKLALEKALEALRLRDVLSEAISRDRSHSSAITSNYLRDQSKHSYRDQVGHGNRQNSASSSMSTAYLSQSVGNLITTSPNLHDISIMVNSNLALQYLNNRQFEKSVELFSKLCEMAGTAGSSIHSSGLVNLAQASRLSLYRFGLNIGNVLFETGDYSRALKYYRLTLDRLSTGGYRNFKIKTLNNIAVATARLKSTIDSISPLNILLSDNMLFRPVKSGSTDHDSDKIDQQYVCNANHFRYALNLMVGLHQAGDLDAMMSTLRSLIKVNTHPHYRRLVLSATSDLGLGRDKKSTTDRTIDSSGTAGHNKQPPVGGSVYATQTDRSTVNALGTSLDQSLTLSADRRTDNRRTDNRRERALLHSGDKGGVAQRASNRTVPFAIDLKQSDTHEATGLARSESDGNMDELETMLRSSARQISSHLMLASNLLLSLIKKQSHRPITHDQSSDTNPQSTSSLFQFIIEQLEHTNHRDLIYNVKVNQILWMLELPGQLTEAIGVLSSIHPSGREQIVNMSPQDTDRNDNKMNAHLPAAAPSMVSANSSLVSLLDGQFNSAEIQARHATSIDPDNSEGWNNLACGQFAIGRPDESFRSLEIASTCSKPRSFETNYNSLIVAFSLCNNIDNLNQKARNFINDLDRYKDSLIRGKLVLGLIIMCMIDKEKGRTLCDELLAGSFSSPEIYLIHPGNQGDNISTLQEGLDEFPFHIGLMEKRIGQLVKNYEYVEATKLISTCIKLRQYDVKWQRMMAECQTRATDYQAAIETYERAISVFPHDISCLKSLITLCGELGLDKQKQRYQDRLSKLT